MPLTDRMAGVLQRIARANRPPFHAMSPPQARALYEQAAEVLDLPRAPLHRVEPLLLPGAGDVRLAARRYEASDAPCGTLLYLHGGGFTVGSLETHDSLCRQLALHGGVTVVALDYRLAPEHRFPTAVDDAWAALRCLHAEAPALGLRGPLAVGGDSAGATLAAVCALKARDHGLPLAAQLLITPGTAATADAFESRRRLAHGHLLDEATIEWFFAQYIDAADREDWRFAPLNAESLDDVAPALLILAECDPLVDEGLAYGDRLRRCGVSVELELFRGVTHDFIKMGRVLDEARAAQAAAGDFLHRRLDHR